MDITHEFFVIYTMYYFQSFCHKWVNKGMETIPSDHNKTFLFCFISDLKIVKSMTWFPFYHEDAKSDWATCNES